jgi:UDP-N-acetylglucosamine 1-carboxyvinyltransferase
MLGPLLARIGKLALPAPGGCRIGARPVDLHMKGLAALGATIELQNGVYHAKTDELVGAEIYLDLPSAGATQHLMATATLARGCTVIRGASMEPEVIALAEFLNAAGARIEGAGTSMITINGVQSLSSCTFRVESDRMQAGTYLLAAAITMGDVTVKGIRPEHQAAVLSKLREAGADISEGHDWVRVVVNDRLTSLNVKTIPYPGFPTDLQQPMAAVLTLAEGTSVVEETIYESRIGHVQELNRMGAKIRMDGGSCSIITGVDSLSGATVEASDLRAGAALVLAGLAAEGDTIVKNVHWIDRGYERLEQTLTSLGGHIERVVTHDHEISI